MGSGGADGGRKVKGGRGGYNSVGGALIQLGPLKFKNQAWEMWWSLGSINDFADTPLTSFRALLNITSTYFPY